MNACSFKALHQAIRILCGQPVIMIACHEIDRCQIRNGRNKHALRSSVRLAYKEVFLCILTRCLALLNDDTSQFTTVLAFDNIQKFTLLKNILF